MKISIIIPVYGVEKFIAKCLTSLFEQTYKNIEYIFVNDCSKDHSIDILNKFIEQLPNWRKENIIVINKKKNEGLPQARRTGIASCSGNYVMHCDADDWLESNAVEILVNKILHTNADIIYFNYIKEYENSSEKSNELLCKSSQEYYSNIIGFNNQTGGYCWNKIIKRELYDNNIEYPIYNMHEDVALTSQLVFYAKTIEFEPSYLYHYVRYNNESICKSFIQNNKQLCVQTSLNRFIICKFLYENNSTKVYEKQYLNLLYPILTFFAFHGRHFTEQIRILKKMIKDLPVIRIKNISDFKTVISLLILQIIPNK